MRAGLRRIPLLVWIVSAVAAVALIAWPLGGWDTVRVVSKELPSYAEGQTFHGHRFDVAIGDVSLSVTHPAGFGDAKPGTIYLIAKVDVTNVWHEPSGSGSLTDNNLILENGKYDSVKTGPSVVLDADGTSGPELNEGLKRTVDLVWTIPDTAVRPGDTVHFTLYDSIPRAGLVVHGTSWADLFAAGRAEREVSG